MSVECLVFIGDPQVKEDAPLPLTFAAAPRKGERVYFMRPHEGEACTNQAESYFSRLRRAEAGHHHHISGRYLLRYGHLRTR